MDNFDERPLERATPDESIAGSRPQTSRAPIVLVAALGLIVGGAAAWWWTRAERTPPVMSTNSTEAAIVESTVPARELPPVGQMDTYLRALLGTLSMHPDFARWLSTDDLVRQMANGIERIARGYSPAADLPMLRPGGDFEVSRRGRTTVISEESYARYDRIAQLVDSLEPRGVVVAYRTVQPRLDEAYRALGRTSGSVDDAINAALQLLLDTPTPSEPVAVVPGKGATFAYQDPALERLRPMQKQLIRMGPGNMQRIQARLRAIRAELMKSDNRVR